MAAANPTKEDLKHQVDVLTEQLSLLQDKESAGSTRLDKLNIDKLTPKEQSVQLDVWFATVRRQYKKRKAAKPNLAEEAFLLDVVERMEGESMRAYLVLEKTGSEPTTITDLENFIRNTFLIKPQGEAAYSEFKLARQQKRTPREYLLHLKSLAALSNGDAEAGDISDEMIFFKFKTTLWEVIQNTIEKTVREDRIQFKQGMIVKQRDLTTVEKYLPLAEHVYEEIIKNQQQAAKDRDRRNDRPPNQVNRNVNNNAGGAVNNISSVGNIQQPPSQPTGGIPLYKDLADGEKAKIFEFQKAKVFPLTSDADKKTAMTFKLCFNCGKYGHRSNKCRVVKNNVNAVNAGENNAAANSQHDSGKDSGH